MTFFYFVTRSGLEFRFSDTRALDSINEHFEGSKIPNEKENYFWLQKPIFPEGPCACGSQVCNQHVCAAGDQQRMLVS
jgi:hypothetical protein